MSSACAAASSTAQPPEPSKDTPVFSLPPPYSYEDLYSSYQNEWDQQRRIPGKEADGAAVSAGTAATAMAGHPQRVGLDERVSALEWVTLPHGDTERTYLLACTGAGEVLAWKLTHSTENSNYHHNTDSSSSSRIDPDPSVKLTPHSRLRVCCQEAEEDCEDEDWEDEDDKALHGLCIARVAPKGDTDTKSRQPRGRKRQRPQEASAGDNNPQLVLMVAGEGGLWSIPLLEFLQQPWEPPATTTSLQQQQPPNEASPGPTSLVQWSDRPIQKLQTASLEGEEEEEAKDLLVLALEKYTNTLVAWKASAIHYHRSRTQESLPTPDQTIDLARIFSGASVGTGKPKSKRRKPHRHPWSSNSSTAEHATTLLVVPSFNNSDSSAVLVGTDRSNLWILPLPLGDGPQPRVLSLTPEKGSTTAPTNSFRPISPTVWSVTDILATPGGTWWTVAATTTSSSSSRNHKTSKKTKPVPATGLLMTWHASTGMVTARQETREALGAICFSKEHQTLYSAANEGAISVWDSPFGLHRQGRFWTSPPSSKALAICNGTSTSNHQNHPNPTFLAVAGVGNAVDLFVDHCRIQTVRIE